MCVEMLKDWMVKKGRDSIFLGRNHENGGAQELSISGTATYQPFDGIMELKMVFLFYYYYHPSSCNDFLLFSNLLMMEKEQSSFP